MCALIRPQFLWKALTFLWYTSSPTCLLPTPCTIQLSDSRSLPTRAAFADCDFQLLDLPLAFYLGFWWWVSWRPWAMCFWATELVEPRVNQTWDFDTVWILRWVGPRPFASRGAVISCGYFCLVCLEPMEHNHYGCYACGLRDFFGLEELLFFRFVAVCRE